MPLFHIEMFEGRSVEQKKRLMEEVTRVTSEVLGCPPDSVDIILTELKRVDWATGGVRWSERS